MNLAMLVRQFSPHGGLELYAHKLVEGLLREGISVCVVCQDKKSSLEHELLSFKMIAPEIAGIGKRRRLQELYKAANQALAELGDDFLVHSQHCPTKLADLVTFHNHSTRRLSEVGLWWEAAVNDYKRNFVPAYKLRDEQDEILLRRAHCLIFPAEVMKDDYYRQFSFLQGPPAKPYVVAHPGSSLASEYAADTLLDPAQQSETFNFLFVGRGFRKKGLDVLLSACCLLNKLTDRRFRLLIAGLPERAPDKLRLKFLGLDKIVEYLGFQKDMDAVYARARVLVLPSRVEPFGMAPVQAMQRGLVPIVSRVSGVAEVMSDKTDALILANHLDAGELSRLMLSLMNDEALLKMLSQNARKTAEKVSWEDTVRQTLKAYEIALSLKNSGQKEPPA